MNIKRIVIIGSLFLALWIGIVYILFIREEKLEDISIQVANVREMKDYDLTTMGESVKDNIYEKYDTVKFGRYYQGKFGYKKKSIDWIVLEKKEDRVLLMSKYILDCKFMMGIIDGNRWRDVYTWTNSFGRKWLNSDFLDIAFNNNEKEKIIEVQLKNKYEGKTNDKVFLLNEEEFRKYFKNDMYYNKLVEPDYDDIEKYRDEIKRYYDEVERYKEVYGDSVNPNYDPREESQDFANATTIGTDYAFSQGLEDWKETFKQAGEDFSDWAIKPILNTQAYWLREASSKKSSMCKYIKPWVTTTVSSTLAKNYGYGIRPAIWVSLKE